jgi:hypothetical protein
MVFVRERIYVYYSINIIIKYSQKIYKSQSCTSLNPGNPDSDNHNKKSPNSEEVTLPIC